MAVYKLNIPTIISSEAYTITVSTIRKKERRAPYLNAAKLVQSRCNTFDSLASNLQLERAIGSNFDVQGLSTAEMSALYDPQFVGRKGTRDLRDGIKNAAPNSLCPYCGEGKVAQIDHYLPKESYAGTTVHPPNLVPACADCNFAKLAYAPGPSSPAVLHPYFDSAYDIPWLSAKISEGKIGKPVIAYAVRSSLVSRHLASRLETHMTVFNLWNRFSTWAGQSLDNFGGYLTTNHGQYMSLLQARDHLERMEIQQSGGRVNSWEGAAHKAMRTSDWYLNTYLKLT